MAAADLVAGRKEALQPVVVNVTQTIRGEASQHAVEGVEEVDTVVLVAPVVSSPLGWRVRCHRGSLEQAGSTTPQSDSPAVCVPLFGLTSIASITSTKDIDIKSTDAG